VHTLFGGRGQNGGFDALDYRKIKQGNAGPWGTYAILCAIISIIAIMLINAIFNIYLIVSTAIYTIFVELFNVLDLAVRYTLA
jgi:hypothetical protein